MSGNGWHLLYPVILPNDDESTELVKHALSTLASHLAHGGMVVILERLRQPNETMDAAGHVAFRSLQEYRQALDESGLIVRHHRRIHLQVEDLWKDILVIGQSGNRRS